MAGVVVVVQRRDHKLYPPHGQLPMADRERAIALTHAMRCEAGLSYRRIVAALAGTGLRVSVGSVHTWIRSYRCAWCRGDVTEITMSGAEP